MDTTHRSGPALDDATDDAGLDVTLLRRSFAQVIAREPDLTARFYEPRATAGSGARRAENVAPSVERHGA